MRKRTSGREKARIAAAKRAAARAIKDRQWQAFIDRPRTENMDKKFHDPDSRLLAVPPEIGKLVTDI